MEALRAAVVKLFRILGGNFSHLSQGGLTFKMNTHIHFIK